MMTKHPSLRRLLEKLELETKTGSKGLILTYTRNGWYGGFKP